MLQAIKRINYHAYYWSRVDNVIITDILLQDNGWIVGSKNEEVCPLWFSVTFLISFIQFHGSLQVSYHLSSEKFEKLVFSWFHSSKDNVVKLKPVLIIKTK